MPVLGPQQPEAADLGAQAAGAASVLQQPEEGAASVLQHPEEGAASFLQQPDAGASPVLQHSAAALLGLQQLEGAGAAAAAGAVVGLQQPGCQLRS